MSIFQQVAKSGSHCPSCAGFTPHHLSMFKRRKELLPKNGATKSGAGFTLIEVVVTLGVFSIAALMAVNVFVIFVQQQRRTVNQQELQNDARAVMEQVANDLREGVLDYEYYKTTIVAPGNKLFSLLDGVGNDCLVLRDALNMQIRYRLNGTIIERVEVTVPTQQGLSCNDALFITPWGSITPSVLTVDSFKFFASPSEDPFSAQTPEICTVASPTCRWGTICLEPNTVLPTCQYMKGGECYCTPLKFSYGTQNDGFPLHPRVTISMKISRSSGQQSISQTFQTTIASRIFKNIDRLNQYVK